MLVEQDELRINVGFDRKFMEQARTETVNGGDYGAFQSSFVTQPRLALLGRRSPQNLVHARAHALAHLVRGAISESDRDDVINRNLFRAQDFEIALDQHERFARTRSGSHRQMTIERVRGRPLLGLKFANG